MTLAQTGARVHVIEAVAGAVFGAEQRDIHLVGLAAVAALVAMETAALAVHTHAVAPAVGH